MRRRILHIGRWVLRIWLTVLWCEVARCRGRVVHNTGGAIGRAVGGTDLRRWSIILLLIALGMLWVSHGWRCSHLRILVGIGMGRWRLYGDYLVVRGRSLMVVRA